MERRIAAILVSDMVGFSRLVELDESGTLARQKRHRLELIDPTIKRFHGHIVKLTGDGMIAEFGSVVEAVQCAVSVQNEMSHREADQPSDRQIRYRIAVNLGDVVFDDGDIYGDGVNIAARLEALAEPGGVVVSGTAYDLLKSHIDVGYKSLGEKHLKNIATPVRVYQITAQGTGATSPTRSRRRINLALIVALLVVVAGAFWWQSQPDFEPADPQNLAFALPEKPSIAVAPFANLTGDRQQANLSDGLSASLISALTVSPDLVVISVGSMSDMRDISAAEIAEKYGVRYVLQGSVQTDQSDLRISAQLVDAISGRTIWADQWDRSTDNIFEVQDEISDKVFEELQVKLTLGEQARTSREKLGTPENIADWLRGRDAYHTWSNEGLETATQIWGAIYQKNPELAGPNELMSQLHFQSVVLGVGDYFENTDKARRFIEKAVDIGGDGQTYAYLALMQFFSNEALQAYENVDLALSMNPGDPEVLMWGGVVFAFGSRLEKGIDMMQRGMRLQPYHPPWVVGDLCHALYRADRYDEAKELALEAIIPQSKDIRVKLRCLGVLTAMSVQEGDMDQARVYVDQFHELEPNISRSYFYHKFGMVRIYDQEHVTRFLALLDEAGMF